MNDLADRIASQLLRDPFPHAILRPALPWELYWKLYRCWPDSKRVVQSSHRYLHTKIRPNTNHQMHWGFSPSVDRCWRKFMDYHTGSEWWQAIDKAAGITTLYPQVRLSPPGLRYRDHSALQLDAFFSVNTPADKHGSVKGPHLDNPREVFACLIYFPEPKDQDNGGDLALYRLRERASFHGKQMTEDVDQHAVVPYRHNTGIFFINTPKSCHGVLPRKPNPHYRRYINIEAEWKDPLFSVFS